MRVGIGRQGVPTETGRLRGRIGKEELPCPQLRLAEVQTDPCDGTLPEGDFRGVRGCISTTSELSVPLALRCPEGGKVSSEYVAPAEPWLTQDIDGIAMASAARRCLSGAVGSESLVTVSFPHTFVPESDSRRPRSFR